MKSVSSLEGIGSHIRDLEKHGADEVGRLDKLQGDVHMEGHLTPLLHQLLLGGLFLVPSNRDTLGQKLLDVTTTVEVIEARVGLDNEASAERGETELRHGSVVKDLGGDVHVGNIVLEMTHKQEVAGAVKVVLRV